MQGATAAVDAALVQHRWCPRTHIAAVQLLPLVAVMQQHVSDTATAAADSLLVLFVPITAVAGLR
jgi:hypothetical protein